MICLLCNASILPSDATEVVDIDSYCTCLVHKICADARDADEQR
jgi:hypothetical protein